MDLKIEDVRRLLSVSENQVTGWIRGKNLPAYKIKNAYYFNRAELGEWVLTNRHLVPRSAEIHRIGFTEKPVRLTDLLKRGGVYYDIAGETVEESIRNTVAAIRIPPDLNHEDVYIALMQREEMMSTAVGKGIAFPHPRCPIISDIDSESISICFLKNRIDYKALDGEKVGVLFVIISSNSRHHLEILSKMSFLCRQDTFLSLLHSGMHEVPRPGLHEASLREYIKRAEAEWSAR